ncbi:MAG: hypothetical protein ACR2NU_16520 [Aeoliella sp.]
MALPKLQAPQDWLSQLWNIMLGERVDLEQDAWLLGPIGDIGGIADRFIERLARDESLSIVRNEPSSGLIDGFSDFPTVAGRVHAKIEDFYQHTADYEFDVWSAWRGAFALGGNLIYRTYSKRVQQLNLPQRSLDTAEGVSSEIIQLIDNGGQVAYTVWYRKLNSTGEVVYSGVYSRCHIPSGENCLKIVFPLPQGSATVIMRLSVDEDGNLLLTSAGKRTGDPGFYFLVEDSKGQMWKHYLPSFQEKIFVFVDQAGETRAEHTMQLRGRRVCELRYRMRRLSGF